MTLTEMLLERGRKIAEMTTEVRRRGRMLAELGKCAVRRGSYWAQTTRERTKANTP